MSPYQVLPESGVLGIGTDVVMAGRTGCDVKVLGDLGGHPGGAVSVPERPGVLLLETLSGADRAVPLEPGHHRPNPRHVGDRQAAA